jgi:hypothetical protein
MFAELANCMIRSTHVAIAYRTMIIPFSYVVTIIFTLPVMDVHNELCFYPPPQ